MLNIRREGKTVHVVFKYLSRLQDRRVGIYPLTAILFLSWSIDISFYDDVTGILLLGVSFMVLTPGQGVTKRCRLSWLTNRRPLIWAQMRREGGSCGLAGVSANEYSCTQEPKSLAKINFGDLTRFLTYAHRLSPQRLICRQPGADRWAPAWRGWTSRPCSRRVLCAHE
jgi:hypothetical protein